MNGGFRVDDTPVHKAIREALANCLVNADYYRRRGLVIVKQRDLITLPNPGDFRVELAEARSGGMSDPRPDTFARNDCRRHRCCTGRKPEPHLQAESIMKSTNARQCRAFTVFLMLLSGQGIRREPESSGELLYPGTKRDFMCQCFQRGGLCRRFPYYDKIISLWGDDMNMVIVKAYLEINCFP